MQKILNALASLAAIVLFAAVMVTSSISAAILAMIGLVSFAVIIPALLFLRGNAEPLRSPQGVAMRVFPIAIAAAWIVDAATRPDHYFDHDTLSGFGFLQAIGVVGMLSLVALAGWLSYRRANDFYRRCPYCFSVIRREARRCRHCTAEVAPEDLPGDGDLNT